MNKRRYNLPSLAAFSAFESAARFESFSLAAEELNTSQSAISRHINDLELRLGIRLFDRINRKVVLNEAGKQYYHSIVSGLESLQTATNTLAQTGDIDQLTIACTHEISHLVMMPIFEKLQEKLGKNTHLRIMTFEYDMDEGNLDTRIDMKLMYRGKKQQTDGFITVLEEAVIPVCSPAFHYENSDILSKSADNWSNLPFLELTKPNEGWGTWADWFSNTGYKFSISDYVGFDNYVYLLEAATAGRGLALGWRGLVDRHLENGTLVKVHDDYVDMQNALCAVLTQKGKSRSLVYDFAVFLGQLHKAKY